MNAVVIDTQIEPFLHHVAGLLRGYRYLFASEYELQDAIAEVLRDNRIAAMREHIFDERNRADFFLPSCGLAIEVKVDGSLPAALRQVDRYCHLEPVNGVLLVSSKLWATQPLPIRPPFAGKSFAMIHAKRASL